MRRATELGRGFAHSNKMYRLTLFPRRGLPTFGSRIKFEQIRDNKDIEREGPEKNEERNRGSKSQEANCHTFNNA